VRFINSDKAPKAVGPYSQAVRVGNFLFISGQIAINPETGKLEGETVAEQTLRVLKNIEAILREAGFSRENVVKTTVYLKNICDFKEMNRVYAEFFGDHRPSRATVEVSNLPLGALVEIEAIAVKE